VARVMERHGLSQRRACRLVGIDHSTLRYRSKRGAMTTTGAAHIRASEH